MKKIILTLFYALFTVAAFSQTILLNGVNVGGQVDDFYKAFKDKGYGLFREGDDIYIRGVFFGEMAFIRPLFNHKTGP